MRYIQLLLAEYLAFKDKWHVRTVLRKVTKIYLIVSPTPFGLQNRLDAPGHAFHKL